MEMTMLEFAEAVLKQLRQLQADAKEIVLSGSVTDMERYRYLMGRLEGLKFSEDVVKDLLKKNSDGY
jgi:hypothetical protein